MARVITDGTPIESAYEPPQAPQREAPSSSLNGDFVRALSGAIVMGFREAIAGIPAPVVNVPKPEVKINSPVYVQPPEIKIPATTVNIPDGKAPVVNIEPASVTLQTNRPNEWEFKVIERNEFGQVVTIRAKAIS